MKRVGLLVIGIILTLLMIAGVVVIVKNESQLSMTNAPDTELPEVVFKNLKGQEVSISKITQNDKLLLFFNSDCDYCQEKAKIFSRKKAETEGIDVYWISSEPYNNILNFYQEFNLDQDNFHFLEDSEGFSYTHFNIKSTPTFLHYDSKGKFIKKFPDDAPVGFILDQIKGANGK